jgi:L-Ala-D/L-Glu epimerase
VPLGYGEAAPFPAFNGETQAAALAACAGVEDMIVGRDLHAWETFRVLDACGKAPSAACAVETALVDALARFSGVSLVAMFGGREQELVTDVTITTGSAADAVREAREFRDFHTLKIKVGRDIGDDIARVVAVREARPDSRILVDANAGFSVDEAVRFIAELRKRDAVPALFEQPIAAGSWEALAEVRARTGVTIAIDESATSVADVAAAHAHRAADAVNVKITKSAIREAIAIAKAAERHGLDRMIGGMVETRLAMGTSACIAAGLGGFAYVDLDTPLFLADDPFVGGYTQRGDVLDLRAITRGHGCVPKR